MLLTVGEHIEKRLYSLTIYWIKHRSFRLMISRVFKVVSMAARDFSNVVNISSAYWITSAVKSLGLAIYAFAHAGTVLCTEKSLLQKFGRNSELRAISATLASRLLIKVLCWCSNLTSSVYWTTESLQWSQVQDYRRIYDPLFIAFN